MDKPSKTKTSGAKAEIDHRADQRSRVNDDLDLRIIEIDRSEEIRNLRLDFGVFGIRVELIRGDEAPIELRGKRPQAWVDTSQRKALCLIINEAKTAISDVIYVGAEALAVAHDFPREPGNRAQEALVNAFAMTYITSNCGPDQALRSFKLQLSKLRRARLQNSLSSELRAAAALRCWAISTALESDDVEVLLSQVALIDERTATLIERLTQQWGRRSPSSGVDAEQMLASCPL